MDIDYEDVKQSGDVVLNGLGLVDIPLSSLDKNYFSYITTLDVCQNRLQEIPKSITELNQIKILSLNDNQISFIPEYITELTNLKKLRLGQNLLTDIPEYITNLTSLEFINFNNNKLKMIPEFITRCKSLKEVLISQNYIDIGTKSFVDIQINNILLSGSNDQFIPCKIEDRLYLGSMSSSKNKEFLIENNISHILVVGVFLHQAFPDDFEYLVIKIDDIEEANITLFFDSMHQFIDEGIENGGILVHCAAGVSRSATAIISYLMKKFSLRLDEAYQKTKDKRFCINPNKGFMDQLKIYEKILEEMKEKN